MVRGPLGLVLVTNFRFQVTWAWFLRLKPVHHVWGGTMGAVRVMGGNRLDVWRNVLRVGRWAMCRRMVSLCQRCSVGRRRMWWNMLLMGPGLLVVKGARLLTLVVLCLFKTRGSWVEVARALLVHLVKLAMALALEMGVCYGLRRL